MALRTVEELVTQVRRQTDNQSYSETEGIAQAEFVQFLNDAQDFLQAEISSRFGRMFEDEVVYSVVANQEAYDLPADAYGGVGVHLVEYSDTGLVRDYLKLDRLSPQLRDSSETTFPFGYFITGTKLSLSPIPNVSRGTLRVSYERELDDLQLRAGEITGTTRVGGLLTRLTLADNDYLNEPDLNTARYVCVGNFDGGVLEYNIPVSSYSYTTKQLIIPNHTLVSADVTGWQYVTVGKTSTFASKLPRLCERFLIAYCVQAIQDRDSMKTPVTQNEILKQMLVSILDTLSLQDAKDVTRIPIIDPYWFS